MLSGEVHTMVGTTSAFSTVYHVHSSWGIKAASVQG